MPVGNRRCPLIAISGLETRSYIIGWSTAGPDYAVLAAFFRASLCFAWQLAVLVQAQFPSQHFPLLLLQQFGALSGQLRPSPHGLPTANVGVGNQSEATTPKLNALTHTQSKSRLLRPWRLP